MTNEADLLEAQAVLSLRWLARAYAAGVVGMRRIRNTEAASNRAGDAVHGFGVGRRTVEGRLTDISAVTAYVIQKLPKRSMLLKDRVPSSVDGVPVDVVESPPAFVAASLAQPRRTENGGGSDVVVRAGRGIRRAEGASGTVASFCRSTRPNEGGFVFALSNSHVLAGLYGQQGDPICQPSYRRSAQYLPRDRHPMASLRC